MIELVQIKFKSEYLIDNNKEIIEFEEKGYKKIEEGKIIIYFKNENKYKFTIENEILEVKVNDSLYRFDIRNKTEAIIKNNEYSYNASLTTNKLNINSSLIQIEYTLDFITFIGKYTITLELV